MIDHDPVPHATELTMMNRPATPLRKPAAHGGLAPEASGMRPFLDAVRELHDHFGFRKEGAEDMYYRLTLCMEELGEIAQCISKGKGKAALEEEHADLFILLLGNCIALDLDIEGAFWSKLQKVMNRKAFRLPDGKIRVTATPGPGMRAEDAAPIASAPTMRQGLKSTNPPLLGGNP